MRILCWLSILTLGALAINGQERITKFTSDIIVNTDATLRVQEIIEVEATGATIIHGIIREFPTSYKHNNINYIVDFEVQAVAHNGNPTPFWIESVKNGKKVYIGDKEHRIATGTHTYVIIYTTNRQLGFFNDHDELYWNVTGNGWRLPIDRAYASVQLPSAVPATSITAEGYTGLTSEQGKEYTYSIENNRINFATTHRLQPYHGFTIVVTWPKGIVHEPSWYQKTYWLLKDNAFFAWTLLILLIFLSLIIYTAIVARRKNKPGTIIPLFYPPQGLTPSVVGFMKAKKFNEKLLAADIVNLAVHGFITISFKEKGFFKRGTYTLQLIKDPTNSSQEGLSNYESALLSKLFDIDNNPPPITEITITQENKSIIDTAMETTSKQCKKQTSNYVVELKESLILGGIIVIVWSTGALFLETPLHKANIIGWLLSFYVIKTTIEYFNTVYTPEGRKIQDQIDGFELYLTTAETERMNSIGTPPTQTPELYEKYLPYAIALGVEKQWTKKFASLFAKLAEQQHPYTPQWYIGRSFKADSFASNIGSSFHSAISSASTPPGTSSGSGGRGRSGGGGGGGGGGGW